MPPLWEHASSSSRAAGALGDAGWAGGGRRPQAGGRQGGRPATYGLGGEHLVDAVVVLLRQDGQLARLLVLEALEDALVLALGRGLQQVVAQGLVLPRLDLTRVLELLLDLQLLGLGRGRGGGGPAGEEGRGQDGTGRDGRRETGANVRDTDTPGAARRAPLSPREPPAIARVFDCQPRPGSPGGGAPHQGRRDL